MELPFDQMEKKYLAESCEFLDGFVSVNCLDERVKLDGDLANLGQSSSVIEVMVEVLGFLER